ncbi:unnamed protein product [Didymodactylos carnosus]|nr:unnamed protein product [Didymodactylos carnosus]CAF4416239.1 unnamed protein product [Didymodactylos carnosus]
MQQTNDTLSLILPIPTDINELYLLNDTFTSPLISTIISKNSTSYLAFSLIILPILTIFGNVLVVISVYREKSLHTVTNYFVVSLAIADITVASIVMPFAIYLECKTAHVKGLEVVSHKAQLSAYNAFNRHVIDEANARRSQFVV